MFSNINKLESKYKDTYLYTLKIFVMVDVISMIEYI